MLRGRPGCEWSRAEARIPFTASLWLVLVLTQDGRNNALNFHDRRGREWPLPLDLYLLRNKMERPRVLSAVGMSKLPVALLLRNCTSDSSRCRFTNDKCCQTCLVIFTKYVSCLKNNNNNWQGKAKGLEIKPFRDFVPPELVNRPSTLEGF